MGFKLWKIKVLFVSLLKFFFNIIHSILILFLLKIKKNRLEIKKNKKILIVGTGKSLDNIDFGEIKNCSIILLNNSWQLFDKFNKNLNEIYFFTASSGVLNTISHELPKNINKIFICTLLNLNLESLLVIFKKNTNLYLTKFYKYNYYEKGKVFFCKALTLKYGFYKSALQKINSFFFTEKEINSLPYTSLYLAIAFFSKLNAKQIVSIGFDNNNHNILNYSKHINLSSYKKRREGGKIQLNYKTRLIKNSLWNNRIYNELKKLDITWYDLNHIAETKHPNRINLNKLYDLFKK